MKEYQLKLAGCDCAVVEWNPEGSILVFALHGWLDNLATFESLAKHMSDLRLVAIDFPGHGNSEHLAVGKSYHFIDGLLLIEDLAQHFEQERVFLLGHSMGGAISTLYAGAKPDKVAGLVLIESLGPLTATPEESVELLQRALSQRELLAEKKKPTYENFEQAFKARAQVADLDSELLTPIVKRGLLETDEGYTWKADSRLRVSSAIRLSEEQLKTIIQQITAPTLLIEGNNSFLANQPTHQKRKSDFNDLGIVNLKGGHHIHLEHPQQCSRVISQFLLSMTELVEN